MRLFASKKDINNSSDVVYTKENPSPRYQELLEMYHVMSEEKRKDGVTEVFAGYSLEAHVEPVAQLIQETDAKTLLDFGAGKGALYQDAPDHPPKSRYKVLPQWGYGNTLVTCYDPAYEPFSAPYQDIYDAVISTDVMEHISEPDISWVLDDLFSHAKKFIYIVAACYPAKKILPDGTNAHCTLRSPKWWAEKMRLATKNRTNVRAVLCTVEKSYFAFGNRKSLRKKGMRSKLFIIN